MAKPPAIAMRLDERGQVLAFFALVLPAVLLPVAAYAVDATIVAAREAGLQVATAEAAEAAAQRLNVSALRSSDVLTLDAAAAKAVADTALAEEEPGATVEACAVTGAEVTLLTRERVTLPLSVFTRTVNLHATATARLVAGYDTPS